jgi:hypothetical protein
MRAIQMKSFLLGAVIQDDVETSRHCDDQLAHFLVRVPAALSSTRNVVKVVDPPDFERNVARSFDEREIATRIMDLGKVDQFAVLNTSWGTSEPPFSVAQLLR